MRISESVWLAGAIALAGCWGTSASEEGGSASAGPRQNPGLAIPCALGGAGQFSDGCTVEQSADAEAVVLTLRHPDGGFRRLRVTRDGRGVVAADGAQSAQVAVDGDRQIAVTIGSDRYKLPATVSAR
ncbi:hypothetical protein RN629_02180 [Sphingomonadaceae bacterium jetA1]|jgi:hypothetical protein|uniref:hypothetical protein n=1 Tax=Facivitalis istanbulensis TaxID=3075838 RepID=UPI003495252A